MRSLIEPCTVPLKRRRKDESQGSKALFRPEYRDRPIEFIEELLNKQLTDDQKAIAISVRDNESTLVPSSHGQGKTALSAWLALWWVFAVQGECITTAPTDRQVRRLLWKEIRKAYPLIADGQRCDQTQLKLTEEAQAYGFTAADHNSNAFQGEHADRLLVLIDEACGMSQELWEGAESCTTGTNNRLLAVGNPITTNVPFETAIQNLEGEIVSLPAWRHPNVSYAYEEYPDGVHRLKPEYQEPGTWKPDLIPGAISVKWIEKTARKKGENSLFWLTRVEARFPTDSEQSIVPRAYFDAARAKYDNDPEYWEQYKLHYPPRYGLDVGDGGDAHALAEWHGNLLTFTEEKEGLGDMQDVDRAADWLESYLKGHGGTIGLIDQIGVGAGALSRLIRKGYSVGPFRWGHRANEPLNYLNQKAEQFWALREAMREGKIAIAPLGEYEDDLRKELAGIYYQQDSKGAIRIEPKDVTRARLKKSPNLADAVVGGFRRAVMEVTARESKSDRRVSSQRRGLRMP